MALTHQHGARPPAAEQQSVINIPPRGGTALPPPGGRARGGEEAQRSSQVLGALMIPVSFALLVAPPPQPVELYTASIFLVLCTGILLIGLSIVTHEKAPKMLTKTMNMDMIAWLRDWATWVAGASLLQVFVLGCCLQLPSSSLIRAGLLFIAMLLIYAALPLLLRWIKHMGGESEAVRWTDDRHPNVSGELKTETLNMV